jgi:hypothetical protein
MPSRGSYHTVLGSHRRTIAAGRRASSLCNAVQWQIRLINTVLTGRSTAASA